MSESNHRPSLDSLVREAISRWRGGEQPDARAFLEAHPEVQERKTLAIDLIYEEYCLRQEQGETCVASTFCNRFPAYKQSLRRMLDVHKFMAAAGTPAAAWPELGSEFLGFEIVEQIGAGAVAKVFLARESDVGGRQVVIKVSQFGRGEARLLGRLAHPGVVPIHSVREDPLTGMTCICMPFLGTATLVDILDEAFLLGAPPASAQIIGKLALGYLPAGIDPAAWGPMDPFFRRAAYEEGIVHLGRQIVAALSKAHQAGIAHRDIKPSNVLLSRDGRPMLLDFNLSIDERLPAERIGGTLAYMAPEQLASLRDDTSAFSQVSDPRSDLYSVGAMLFELLTGKLPSRPVERAGQGPPPVVEWIKCKNAAPPSARKLNPHVEPALDAILLRALAPLPSDRHSSAEELAAELDALLSPQARLMRTIRARRRWLLAAGAAAATASLAGSYYWWTLPPLPVRLYERGLRAYEQESYASAERLFTDSIDAGNDSMEIYFARGQARRQLNKLEGMDKDFGQVIAHDKDKIGIGFLYGAYAGDVTRNYPQAYSLLATAQREGWDYVDVANNLGIAYSNFNHHLPAISHFDRILAQEPDNETAQYNHAVAWMRYSNSKYMLMPDDESIAHAQALAARHPRDLEMLDLAASLLSNAASADSTRYEKLARQSIEAAEAQGEDRANTFFYWQKFTKAAPPPPPQADRSGHKLSIRWRKSPLPTSALLSECLKILQADERLTQPPIE